MTALGLRSQRVARAFGRAAAGLALLLCASPALGSPPDVKLSGTAAAIANARGWVSIVRIGPGRYITANYNHLTLVDLREGRVSGLRAINKPKLYVPTGLAYDEARHRLFIANYRGNDILVGDLDEKARTVTIGAKFGRGPVVSPEGISYDGASGMLATAQYDGNTVAVFERVGTNWRLRCSVPVPQAHGVAVDGANVFAASLAMPALLKIRADDCAVVAKMGTLGWNTAAGEFLYPTAVQRLSGGMIAAIDARAGRIAIIDPATLKVRASFGHNGPGYGALNLPYGFTESGSGHVIVLSTFGDRIVEFTRAGEVAASYSLLHRWPESDHFGKDDRLGPPMWKGWVEAGRPVTAFGRRICGRFMQLVTCDGGAVFNFAMPAIENGPFSGGSYFDFVQIMALRDGILALSPQNGMAQFVLLKKSVAVVVPIAAQWDSWIVGQSVVRPTGAVDGEAFVAQAAQRARAIAGGVVATGGLPLPEIAAGLFAPAEVKTAERDLQALFKDEVAAKFVADSTRCGEEHCAPRRRCEIAGPLAEKLRRDGSADIVELATASQMNGCFLSSFERAIATPRIAKSP